jgi:diguanylate cyclase (GGDEF)-like protein
VALLLPERTARAGVLLGAVFLAMLLALRLLGPVDGPAIARVVSETAFVVFGLFAVGCAFAAACANNGRGRMAWTCITVGAACWVFGGVVKSLYLLARAAAVPFPSVADAGLLALPVATCVGLLLMPVGHSGLSAARLLMDGLTVFGSLFLIGWVAILRDLIGLGGPSPFAFAVALAYPILDLVAIAIGVLVLIRARGVERLPVALLLAGVVLMAVSNVAYRHLVAHGGYTRGDLLDAGWAAAMLAFGLAALASSRRDRTDRSAAANVSSWLPYIPVAVAGVVVVKDLVNPASATELTGAALLVIIVLFRQILVAGQNQRLLAVVADQALRDPLTGLANRFLFHDRLTHAVELHKRELFGVLAVLSLDLDHFKQVNDGLGHAAGDALLVEVATRILNAVRSGDTVARLGGDEFAILIEKGPESPELVAQRVVDAFDEPFVVDGHALSIRPSVGLSIALARDLDLRTDVLLKQSDLAMYTAKRTRTAGVHTFASGMAPLRLDTLPSEERGGADVGDDGAELLEDLRRAVDDGELAVVYQPKIDLGTGGIVGVEALVRWPHPEHGLLEPAAFLPLVRHNGLMDAVTDLVFEKSLADAAHWRDCGQSVPVAVNLFAPSFDDFDLPGRLTAALSVHGLASTMLTVEITEDLVVQDFERTRTVLERLRESGIRVSIDDFGSGYSGLQYLRELPVDEVKLDREFIVPILEDPRAASIVRAVIALVHDLGVICVAEGVESAAIVEQLKVYGCDVAQGYHYGPPVAGPSLLEKLSTFAPLVIQQ